MQSRRRMKISTRFARHQPSEILHGMRRNVSPCERLRNARLNKNYIQTSIISSQGLRKLSPTPNGAGPVIISREEERSNTRRLTPRGSFCFSAMWLALAGARADVISIRSRDFRFPSRLNPLGVTGRAIINARGKPNRRAFMGRP